MEVVMTKKLILLSFIALALMVGGCSKESPVSPQLNAFSSDEILLSKLAIYHASCSMDFSKTMVDPGQVWTDDQGVLHIRNQVYKNTAVTGDFIGIDVHNVFNADIVLATGEGKSWGWNRSDVTWRHRNISGTWTGQYKNRIVGGQMKGTSAYVGSGGFTGLIAKASQEESAPGSLILNMQWSIYEKGAREINLEVE
jgi:hypothetical protein